MNRNYPGIRIFESRAKLMVSGEYLVLKGALSLALPLKHGQKLIVKAIEGESVIYWQWLINGTGWFNATIQLPHFKVIDTNSQEISKTLCRILMAARELNPAFLSSQQAYQVTSDMDFDPQWGLGSGSSLVSNIAYWADCNPFIINRMIFKGSGYDIACARSSKPIIYKKSEFAPTFRNADFRPPFHGSLYFVYLNRKQNSLESILHNDLASVSKADINAISGLTLGMEKAADLATFQSMMDDHEAIISRIIRKPTVRAALFKDFSGSVKSLGAWGGDFILAASEEPGTYVRNYFADKGLTTLFKYREMIPERLPTDESVNILQTEPD